MRDELREMTYYHATTRDRLPLIQLLGLRAVAEKNFPECEHGVYLAGSPELALMFLVEAYTGQKQSTIAPRDFLEMMAVIVIDDYRLDSSRLSHDPQVEDGWQSWVYGGVIDVTNAPILSAETVLSAKGD